jgi:hypothetical protein
MTSIVIKRTGEEVAFDSKKIIAAVNKACNAINEPEMGFFVWHQLEDKDLPEKLGVEQIQDAVEEVLMKYNPKVAREYIRYRYDREQLRMIRPIDLVDKYLDASDWRVKENASVGYSLGGMILNNSGAVTANYWLNKIYPKEIGDAHRDCKFHIHDLSMLSGYCVGHNLLDLIKMGLGGVPGKITSAPPKHFSTLCNQIVNYLGCFTADMQVLMADGTSRTFQDLVTSNEKEFLVKSFDPNTGKIIDAKMDNVHCTRTVEKYLELEFEQGVVIKCTEDHKFYTANRGWVEARDLTEDDIVLSVNRKMLFVYKTTNNLTGEFYIGSHVTYDINDGYLGSGRQLKDAVKKYGEAAFSREILYYATSSQDLRSKEVEFIREAMSDPKCMNIAVFMNHGFDSLNGESEYTELNTDTLYGVCVYKNKKAGYVSGERVPDLLKNGFVIADPTFMFHDSKHDYYGQDVPLDTSKLKEGLRTPHMRGGMLGKIMPEEWREQKRLWNEETKDWRADRIKEGLNRIGEDGLKPTQRALLQVDQSGKTLAKRIVEKAAAHGANTFCNPATNPNNIIMEDGKSLPHHSNMKRVKEGTHNFLVASSMGCHNHSLSKRIKQLLEYFSGTNRWVVSQNTYLDFLSRYPDWTGKFNYKGFIYSVNKAIERNNLSVEVVYEAIKEN